MKRFLNPTFLGIVLLVLAGGWTIDRYFAMRESEEAMQAGVQNLATARNLLTLYPDAIAREQSNNDPPALKALIQRQGVKHKLALVYLTESDKEAGKGFREREVVARAVGVPHAAWVQFLAEVESGGEGATFKEIRLKPSKHTTGVYSEAEAVLAYRWPTEPLTGSEGGRP